MRRYQLSKAGVSVNEGIERFGGDKELYENLLIEFLDDDNYSNLIDAVNKKDIKKAFTYAHSLKGIAGNLSLNRLYETIFPFVEELRNDNLKNSKKYMLELKNVYDEIVEAIKPTE